MRTIARWTAPIWADSTPLVMASSVRLPKSTNAPTCVVSRAVLDVSEPTIVSMPGRISPPTNIAPAESSSTRSMVVAVPKLHTSTDRSG